MSLSATPETLAAIWTALNAPPPARLSSGSVWTRVVLDGWITEMSFEDAVLMADRRLDRTGLKLETFVEMLKLRWRPVFARPESRFDDPSGYQSLSAADAAAVLILLERLGFALNPEPLCSRLRPGLAEASHLTWQEVDVLFHHQSAGRTTPLTLEADILEWRGSNRRQLTTPWGYKVEYAVSDDGSPLWLTVRAPRYRKRAEPVLTSCDCGMTYMKGLPSDDKAHRHTHRRRHAILEPTPNRQFAAARQRDPLGAPWVDARSPLWKHERMYRRAFAFKRELGYDFTQWAEKPAYDPEPVGFLFGDAEDRIVGAAAFRPQPDEARPWRLDWIWLAPGFRRQGYLARHWERFRQRFGEFDIEPPVSEAMKAFLAKRGLSHLFRA